MAEDTERKAEPQERSLRVLVYGNTADELELAALDEAREFFGPERRLEIVPDYKAFPSTGSFAAPGKKYYAGMTVRLAES